MIPLWTTPIDHEPIQNVTVPDWFPAAQHPDAPAGALFDWLCGQGSLTQRLTAAGPNDFRVELLWQGIQTGRGDELQAFGLASGEPLWVREVLLHTAGAPRVFARSVAPLQTLREARVDLNSLGTRSLGELLFSDPEIQRGPIQISRYPAAWLPAQVRAEQLWARRSSFGRGGQSRLLVCEVFLTGWPPASQPHAMETSPC
ncbi:chorismate--pyruvate lyase [Pseudomonas jilinensis]|uniref:Probable chorismate pyruvate-lyase n=1 Tax=Pseudomonas jilinensis TaxID=2078689 RepID=A0A396RZ57_9PSED|nr:chorismate--pyruvate lyase [Pseudomonas jilinensis]